MADAYASWAALAAAEKVGVDYRIVVEDRNSTTSHIGIHAGGIEIGTSEIAKAVSEKIGQPLYLMEGLKSSGNSVLHITSTHFDEPTCVAIQSQMTRTISYHGLSGDTPVTHLGGSDTALMTKVGKALEAAGFTVEWSTAEEVNGNDPANIANRNKTGRGVQLEMTTALRKSFFPDGDWGRPNREDPTKRTDTFNRFRDALASAVGVDLALNPMKVWDGSAWVPGSKKVWNGKVWVPMPTVQFFDGDQWRDRPPSPAAFPTYVTSNSAIHTKADYVGIPVPSGVRVNDFVVSVCASAGVAPQLINPGGYVAQTQKLASGTWISAAVVPYDGRPGDVVWEVLGSTASTAMNLAYRGGDVASTPIAPVKGIKQYANVSEVPLNNPGDFTSVFVVLAESTDLTGYSWPDGVIGRAKQLGKFGSLNISLIASDTPGADTSAGALTLDAVVKAATCITIQIPGSTDGKPTWILGDDKASALGTTTVLG